jgi:hypothetical protein
MVAVSEDGRSSIGLVAADALEHAAAVVKAMAEYVDLGVLPWDEIAVHPDPLRLLHGFLRLEAAPTATRRAAD